MPRAQGGRAQWSIMMTTKRGADRSKRQTSRGWAQVDEEQEEQLAYEEMRKKLTEALKRTFRPEFINRLDSVIVFRALNRDHIRRIVSLEVEKVSERLVDHQLTLKPTDAALDFLAEQGYDPEMGARPVRRIIQQQLEDKLSDAMLAETFKTGELIIVDLEEVENDEGGVVKTIVLKHDQTEITEMEPDLVEV